MIGDVRLWWENLLHRNNTVSSRHNFDYDNLNMELCKKLMVSRFMTAKFTVNGWNLLVSYLYVAGFVVQLQREPGAIFNVFYSTVFGFLVIVSSGALSIFYTRRSVDSRRVSHLNWCIHWSVGWTVGKNCHFSSPLFFSISLTNYLLLSTVILPMGGRKKNATK